MYKKKILKNKAGKINNSKFTVFISKKPKIILDVGISF